MRNVQGIAVVFVVLVSGGYKAAILTKTRSDYHALLCGILSLVVNTSPCQMARFLLAACPLHLPLAFFALTPIPIGPVIPGAELVDALSLATLRANLHIISFVSKL